MKKRVLVMGNLPGDCLKPLREAFDIDVHDIDRPMDRAKLLTSVTDKQGILSMITDAMNEEVFALAPRLEMVSNMAVGYNNIDVKAATARGILVSNTPGVLTDATADLTFALILAIARRVVEGDRMTREGRFRYWAPFLFLGREVSGKTLGIVGLGRIGKALARRARGFEMRILYYNRQRLSTAEEEALNASYVDLKTLLQEADFVSLHVPLTEETRYFIGMAELSSMKPTACLINASRGPVVDEQALVQALKEGKIGGAALDVYENEPALAPGLTDLDNVVLLPHVGSATQETRRRMAQMAVENLMAGLQGQKPPYLVNPEIWPPPLKP